MFGIDWDRPCRLASMKVRRVNYGLAVDKCKSKCGAVIESLLTTWKFADSRIRA